MMTFLHPFRSISESIDPDDSNHYPIDSLGGGCYTGLTVTQQSSNLEIFSLNNRKVVTERPNEAKSADG